MLRKVIRRFGWLTSLLVFSMPLFLITFLGFMMARGQVKGQFDQYQAVQEYTSLSSLSSVADEQVVMVRGRIAEGSSPDWADGLVVFQERPLANRETRFEEEFPLIFPSFTLELSDGSLMVQPGEQQVISHELHDVPDAAHDREYTGFRIGDVVTVQGKWKVPTGSAQTVLSEASGITSLDRAGVMAEGQWAFKRLDSISIVLGALTLLTMALLVIQVLRSNAQEKIANAVSV